MPKLFRLAEDGRVLDDLFAGVTINTPSMLCVEDYLDALGWAESVGGLKPLQARADANAAVLFDWIARTPWIANLAADPATRSNTSVCLRFTDRDGGAGEHRRIADRMDEPAGRRGRGLRHRRLPHGPAGAAHLVRRHHRARRPGSADALARLGLRRGDGRERLTGRRKPPSVGPPVIIQT